MNMLSRRYASTLSYTIEGGRQCVGFEAVYINRSVVMNHVFAMAMNGYYGRTEYDITDRPLVAGDVG